MRELLKPSYIPIDYIMSLPIVNSWNDWDPYEDLEWPSEDLKIFLSNVSNKGITAFSLGCAEWVIWRFASFSQDELPFHYIAAFWLYVMGDESSIPLETDHKDWLGVIRGPINLALMTTLNTIYLADDHPPVQNGALSAKIAEFVLPDKVPFAAWQDAVVSRLLRLCPRDIGGADGFAVAREILDPNWPLSQEDMDDRSEEFANVLKRVRNIAMEE